MELQELQNDAAIMKVIVDEAAAFWNKDYTEWARH